MSSNCVQCHCPSCGLHSSHALLPKVSVAATGNLLEGDTAGLSADQRLICTSCEQTWDAAIVPKSQLERLRETVTSLDDARRQIAMLRLIMTKDQLERAEKTADGVIKLHRAA